MYIRTNSPYKKIKSDSILKTFFIFYFSLILLFSLIFSFILPFYYKKNFIGLVFINSSIVNFKINRNDIVIIENNSDTDYLDILISNIIKFLNPLNILKMDKKNYILYRVIGVEGDKINFQDGKFYVNDKLVQNINKDIFFEFNEIVIPKNSYFCLSIDNSDIFDSTIFGAFEYKKIRGKIIYKRYIKF